MRMLRQMSGCTFKDIKNENLPDNLEVVHLENKLERIV